MRDLLWEVESLVVPLHCSGKVSTLIPHTQAVSGITTSYGFECAQYLHLPEKV